MIINALQNPKAALTGEETFYLADNYDESNDIYEGLRPQFNSTKTPTPNTYIVKTEVAEAQPKVNIKNPISSNDNAVSNNSSITSSEENQGNLTNQNINTKFKNYKATLKLDPKRATLDFSKFMVEVMSHLQDLPGEQDISLVLEIDAKIESGIDKDTARIILENSRDMKVDNPEIS